MENNNVKFTKMRYAFTTMEPTPSNIMTDYETTRDDILQHIYPVLVHQSRVPNDVVALRIEGLVGLRVMFLLRQTKQLLSKTTQLKYRIKPADLVESVVVKHFCNTLFENSPGISSFKWCFPIIVGMRTDMIVPYVHISV